MADGMMVKVVGPLKRPRSSLTTVLKIGYPQGKNIPPSAVAG
jgi:hypothetical protein